MQAIQYDKGDNSWQILTNSGNVIVGFFKKLFIILLAYLLGHFWIYTDFGMTYFHWKYILLAEKSNVNKHQNPLPLNSMACRVKHYCKTDSLF